MRKKEELLFYQVETKKEVYMVEKSSESANIDEETGAVCWKNVILILAISNIVLLIGFFSIFLYFSVEITRLLEIILRYV